MPDTKWPVAHPMLDLRHPDPSYAIWTTKNGEQVPNDIADELNRWATVKECLRLNTHGAILSLAVVNGIVNPGNDTDAALVELYEALKGAGV